MKNYTLLTVIVALLGTPGYSASTSAVPATPTAPVSASTPAPVGVITGTPAVKKEGWAEKKAEQKAAKKAKKANFRCEDGAKDWTVVSSYDLMFLSLRNCATDCTETSKKDECLRILKIIAAANKGEPLNLTGRTNTVTATKSLIKKAKKFIKNSSLTVPAPVATPVTAAVPAPR